MKTHILFLTAVLTLSVAFSQKINYKKFEDKLDALGCTNKNKCQSEAAGIQHDNTLFKQLTIAQIKDKDLVDYYSDYGMNCYKMFLITKDSSYIHQSIQLYENGLNLNAKHSGMLWNLAFDYSLIKKCEKAKTTFNLYLQYTPKKYISKYNREQIEDISSYCTGKN